MENRRGDLLPGFFGVRYVLSVVHRSYPGIDPFSVEDSLALLIIVYSAKRRQGGLARVGGMPSLLEKILKDATTYFLVLSTGHLLLVLFQVLAPVSNHPVDLCSIAHDKITQTPIKSLPGM